MIFCEHWFYSQLSYKGDHELLGYQPFEEREGRDVNNDNSALHPFGVTKSNTSFGWGKGGIVTAAGCQVTLCDPKWYVISRSSEVISIMNSYVRVYFYFTLL